MGRHNIKTQNNIYIIYMAIIGAFMVEISFSASFQIFIKNVGGKNILSSDKNTYSETSLHC